MNEGNFHSMPESGYSVDNIAPGVPQGLMAVLVDEGIQITWEMSVDEDYQYFMFEKSADEAFTAPEMFVMIDIAYLDLDYVLNESNYYRIAAVDHAGNISDYSDVVDFTVLATDLDGDRLTDLMADVSDPLRHFGGKLARHLGQDIDMSKVWSDMGYTTGNGRDMTSVMHRMTGPAIHEQTLGSADAMLLRLLDGDESMGGTKQPYDPRIHFVLIRDAYLDANQGNKELKMWLDDALATFDKVYAGQRPGFIDGYRSLKEAIKPWGN